MSGVFTTSFGHQIPLRAGYRKTLPPLSPFLRSDETPPKEDNWGIVSDLFFFAAVTDWMKSLGIADKPFGKLLDLGGNIGLTSRFFRASGMANHATSMDLVDYRSCLDEEHLKRMLAFLKEGQGAYREQEARGVSAFEGIPAQAFAKYLATFTNIYPYPTGPLKSAPSLIPGECPPLQRYIHGDFFDLDEQFDCITLFSALEFFPLHKFFTHASSLLPKGGCIVSIHAYWYWILNAGHVFGDFPYLGQRLPRIDVKRYYQTFCPEQLDQAMENYDYYHVGLPGLTINDICQEAVRCGFEPIGYRRAIPPAGRVPNKIANWELQGDHGFSTLTEVLRDIACFKSGVTMQDLLTAQAYMAFRKA